MLILSIQTGFYVKYTLIKKAFDCSISALIFTKNNSLELVRAFRLDQPLDDRILNPTSHKVGIANPDQLRPAKTMKSCPAGIGGLKQQGWQWQPPPVKGDEEQAGKC